MFKIGDKIVNHIQFKGINGRGNPVKRTLPILNNTYTFDGYYDEDYIYLKEIKEGSTINSRFAYDIKKFTKTETKTESIYIKLESKKVLEKELIIAN